MVYMRIHEENLETIKGRFVVSGYYLLRVYQNKYMQRMNLSRVSFTLLL